MVDSTADSSPVAETAPVTVAPAPAAAPSPAPEPCPAPVATAADALKKGIENNGHSYLSETLAALKTEFETIGIDIRKAIGDLF